MVNKKQRSVLKKWTEIFDTRIYPANAIRKALKDFGPFGSFTVREASGKMLVKAAIHVQSDAHLREEFSNYVLGMVIKCR